MNIEYINQCTYNNNSLYLIKYTLNNISLYNIIIDTKLSKFKCTYPKCKIGVCICDDRLKWKKHVWNGYLFRKGLNIEYYQVINNIFSYIQIYFEYMIEHNYTELITVIKYNVYNIIYKYYQDELCVLYLVAKYISNYYSNLNTLTDLNILTNVNTLTNLILNINLNENKDIMTYKSLFEYISIYIDNQQHILIDDIQKYFNQHNVDINVDNIIIIKYYTEIKYIVDIFKNILI